MDSNQKIPCPKTLNNVTTRDPIFKQHDETAEPSSVAVDLGQSPSENPAKDG